MSQATPAQHRLTASLALIKLPNSWGCLRKPRHGKPEGRGSKGKREGPGSRSKGKREGASAGVGSEGEGKCLGHGSNELGYDGKWAQEVTADRTEDAL
eukprot:3055688-Rhodomonas_salina.1